MDDQKLRVFNSIASFVQDLDTGFGKKYKPVALYNRLVARTTFRDATAVDRHINAFRTFFSSNPKYIQSKNLATVARISYSDRIYLDVGRILSKTETDAHKHIHQHLMTIYSLMNIGTRQGREALETLKKTSEGSDANSDDYGEELDLNLPDTTEGNFIKETLTDMTEQFKNMEDDANPMMMMSNMMQSGFFTKFMGDLQTKFSSGEMDIRSLMGTVTNVISEATPQGGEEAAQIRNFVNQSMDQVATLTGGQDLPPEVQGQMTALLDAISGDTPPPLETEPRIQDDTMQQHEIEKTQPGIVHRKPTPKQAAGDAATARATRRVTPEEDT
jgi:hypothetical protein